MTEDVIEILDYQRDMDFLDESTISPTNINSCSCIPFDLLSSKRPDITNLINEKY